MFSVIFEVNPRPEQWDAYLDNATLLRPELEQMSGFIDNTRYKSLTRDGWILSLSGWRDEKSVVRWRTRRCHHAVQEKGRREILSDYHLRVGQVTADTRIPEGYQLVEQRLDETEIGAGTAITLVDARRSPEWVEAHDPQEIAAALGFNSNFYGDCASWDVFDAVLTPGNVILLACWRDGAAARNWVDQMSLPVDARLRTILIVRDYGMFDRREAPQYYPNATGRETLTG